MLAPGSILLHDNLTAGGKSLLFSAPEELLVAHDAGEARQALDRIEAAQTEGLWAAGYLAYELGFLFEQRLEHLLAERSTTPLLWIGLYRAPRALTKDELNAILNAAGPGSARDIAPSLSLKTYEHAFDRVKDLIAGGDTYQVNLTMRARFALEGDPLGLYRTLAASQPVAYGAYINAGDHTVLSRSPELFVSAEGARLKARPMKGTRRRGATLEDDAAGRAALAADEKNRAENLMIVDLLRNDLGRIAEIGSVRVTDLFTVETYRSLHTMTSGIEAQKRPDISMVDVIRNLFPCGSITGAPKLRAMEIIREVEEGPRCLYTGSIGYIAPNGDFAFNVAIRTAVIDAAGHGEIGIGGGIVADSTARDEYQEALLKLKFLSDPAPPVTLIETLKWTPEEGFVLLDRHLDRLAASAQYFSLGGAETARENLETASGDWNAAMRVRLTLSESGVEVTAVPLSPNPASFRFMVADERLDSTSTWLAHKTTNRAFFDQPRVAAHDRYGVDEVVFLNERGELTEGSITNIFIEREGVLLTPDLSAGLLPGTLRAELIAQGKARAAVLTLADLHAADAIWLGNSVRGLIRADLFEPKDAAS